MNGPQKVERRILSVIGPHSGSGKTTFVAQLVRHISGVGCLKISPAKNAHASFARDQNGKEQDFFLENPTTHSHPDKDTALYLQAGAAHVERLRHRADGLAAGLEEALGRFPTDMPIVVESSSAVRLLQPSAVVLVVRPPMREVKSATRAVLSLVTDLMVNAPKQFDPAEVDVQRLRKQFPAFQPQHTWSADLISQPLPQEMLANLRALMTTS
jgi:molybdopterin-guanine dinucleotide biosynthesis protein